MFGTLADWETYFTAKIHRGERSNGASHAPLLPVVPDRITWDAFLVSVRGEWSAWKSQLPGRPSCLLMLYSGLAFYEYDKHTFWPQFAKAVGSDDLSPNQQTGRLWGTSFRSITDQIRIATLAVFVPSI